MCAESGGVRLGDVLSSCASGGKCAEPSQLGAWGGKWVEPGRETAVVNGTRPIKAPVTRMAISQPDLFYLEN